MMFEYRRRRLWGVTFDGVVYGEGNRICRPGALTEYTRFLSLEGTRYLYWGDIDREGLNIYLRAKQANPKLSVALFLPGYVQMLRRSLDATIPESRDHRERDEDFIEIYALFSDEYREMLEEAIRCNRRIPQEIISFVVLLEEMEV